MGHISVRRDGSKKVEDFLAEAYNDIERGNIRKARELLEQALSIIPYDTELQSVERACVFWEDKLQNIEKIEVSHDRGDYLQHQWRKFEEMCRSHFDHTARNVGLCFKAWAYNTALNYYREQIRLSMDTESMIQAGRCLKALGNFEDALGSFEEAVQHCSETDARIIAEMANAAMLTGKERIGKVFLREALFLDASKVEIEYLDAPVFKRLIERMKGEFSYASQEFNEWLPVYGTLWGVFDVKRELQQVEYDRLNQKIYELSSEVTDGDRTGRIVPRLINCYFWLIDHFETANNQLGIVNAMAKIKHFAPKFYECHLNNLKYRPGRLHA